MCWQLRQHLFSIGLLFMGSVSAVSYYCHGNSDNDVAHSPHLYSNLIQKSERCCLPMSCKILSVCNNGNVFTAAAVPLNKAKEQFSSNGNDDVKPPFYQVYLTFHSSELFSSIVAKASLAFQQHPLLTTQRFRL